MRLTQDCFRALDPRWSFDPCSGEGAALQGGRFNQRGRSALYLSFDFETAVHEASQSFATKLEPLTICLYSVDCEDVIDLRDPDERRGRGIEMADLACAWFVERDKGMAPASWRISQALEQMGAAGILVPSFARTAKPDSTNLVLWRWGSDLPHRVTVHDPSGRLPADQLSWPSR